MIPHSAHTVVLPALVVSAFASNALLLLLRLPTTASPALHCAAFLLRLNNGPFPKLQTIHHVNFLPPFALLASQRYQLRRKQPSNRAALGLSWTPALTLADMGKWDHGRPLTNPPSWLRIPLLIASRTRLSNSMAVSLPSLSISLLSQVY